MFYFERGGGGLLRIYNIINIFVLLLSDDRIPLYVIYLKRKKEINVKLEKNSIGSAFAVRKFTVAPGDSIKSYSCRARKYEPRVVDGEIFIPCLISGWSIEKQTRHRRGTGLYSQCYWLLSFKVKES